MRNAFFALAACAMLSAGSPLSLFVTRALLVQPRCAPVDCKQGSGPPPIQSQFFRPLGSPANFTALLDDAAPDSVSVIKFQAPYCRTCRASSPLLDRVAKQYPQARFYSMDLVRNGKAAGERMNRFFKERGVKLMPYIEIYYGSECIDTEVVPPSALASFEQAVGAAMERLRAASTSRSGASRQLVQLRQFLREKREEIAAATGRSSRRRSGAKSTFGGGGGGAASDAETTSRSQAEDLRSMLASSRRPPKQLSKQDPRSRSKRGAPLRGATGGRRKGWR